MTDDDNDRAPSIPLMEERLRVGRRTVETGTVRVRTEVDEHDATIDEPLHREEVVIERVPINRYVDAPPPVRQEGDVLIYPVLEEVIEKRLVLREELHIRREVTVERLRTTIPLLRQEAVVERTDAERPPRKR